LCRGGQGGDVERPTGLGGMAKTGTRCSPRPPAALAWEDFIRLRPGYKLDVTPPRIDYDRVVLQLPIVDILKSQGLANTDWENLAGRELNDPFFDRLAFLKGDERFNVPALHVNSWYDFGVGGTFLERD